MSQKFGPNPIRHIIEREYGNNVRNFHTNLVAERLRVAKSLYKKDLVSHYGCVNSIEFSQEGELLVSGGDDRRVLLWHLEKTMNGLQQPRSMVKEHQSNIFCLSFNNDNTRIYSGGNDDTVIMHDLCTGDATDVFIHDKPVYGLAVNPSNNQVFATAGEDGRILILDSRINKEFFCLAKYRAPFHAVMFHPGGGPLVVTANAKEGAALWDTRKPKVPYVRYGGDNSAQICMSVRFNKFGTQILALRRRLPPVLFDTMSSDSICQFYHPDYYNSCTMKSCCFGGTNDEYVLSGSDDFNLYAWKIADADCNGSDQWIDTNHIVLYGHRSIVNQVRFNPHKSIIASSGVEKMVKLWSPFPRHGWTGSLTDETHGPDNPREVYTSDEYLSFNTLHLSGQNLAHDYSNQNTNEDPRMMAFFDSLVQQEIEGWDTDTPNSASDSQHSSDNSSRPTLTQSSDSESFSAVYPTAGSCRRGSLASSSTIKPQRTKYPNRIAYLIATKRNTLKRLALKGAAQTTRRLTSKFTNRKVKGKRNALRTTRIINNKRSGRPNGQTAIKRKSRDKNGCKNNKKYPKRRIQQHLNTSTYRSFRRRTKSFPNVGLSKSRDLSSSEGNDYNSDCSNLCASRALTQANISESTDAIPSTSTGITGNGRGHLFRLAQQQHELDSDDDQSGRSPSPPRTLPPRLLAAKIPIISAPVVDQRSRQRPLDDNDFGANDDEDSQSTQDNDHRRRRQVKRILPTTVRHFDTYSSHSNSRLSNSSQPEDESQDSLGECFAKRRRLPATLATPTLTSANPNNTPDSGLPSSSAVCSSVGSTNDANGFGSMRKDPVSVKLFQQNVARVRRNYRNNFGDDSDSD